MKNINVYLLIALAIMTAVVSSLAYSADVVPAVFAALLLGTILVLGMAAGQHDSRREIDRLHSIEAARRVQANCMINTRNRLEQELAQLQLVCTDVGDMGERHAA